MSSRIPENLQFVIVGDDLTNVLFQNMFLDENYPDISRIIIDPDKCDVLEEIGKMSRVVNSLLLLLLRGWKNDLKRMEYS